jgi:hypothetical protein
MKRRSIGRILRQCSVIAAAIVLLQTSASAASRIPSPQRYLIFDGAAGYVEVPASADSSVGAAGLTIEAWLRPDALAFSRTEGSLASEQYVHWLGKGGSGRQEWTFRIYRRSTPPGPRQNRVSFYVFNAKGGRGCGSYFQDPLAAGEWMHIVGVVDRANETTAIYKNGALRHRDSFAGIVSPVAGDAPLRIGTKDFTSHFRGAIGPVRIWSRPLSAAEIGGLYASSSVPVKGLVAQYSFSEGGGSVVHDSAHANTGKLSGGVAWGAAGGPLSSATGTSGGGC